MREILFRAKNLYSNEWIDGFLVASKCNTYPDGFEMITNHGINHDELDDYQPDFLSFHVNPESVGQFTGLTDKNGKKIFEGDIIEWFAQGESEHPDFGYIEYDEQSFAWRVCWQKYDPDFMEGMQQEYISVIGNIHDNPELLENP
jgi:uncharacterized phage protein (TIGR01671 family)